MKYNAREELLKRLKKQQHLKEDVPWGRCIKHLREKLGITDDIAPYKQLRLLRIKLNLTQAEMLELCDTNEESNISRWERQITVPRAADRENLFKYFGIPVDAWDDARREKKFILQRALHEQESPYPAIWNVPFERPALFVGRDEILNRLHKALIERKTPSLTQKISGLGGIGKTLTAIEYAYMYRSEYQAVLWCNASSEEQFSREFADLAKALNLREKNLKSVERVVNAVQGWMRKEEGWLLILDNVEQMADVYSILPTARRGHVIITSRVQELDSSVTNIELDQLTVESGALLLLRKAEMLGYADSLESASEVEQEQAKLIAQDMGGLPLALNTAGAHIKEEKYNLQEFSALYRALPMKAHQWRSIFSSSEKQSYPYTVVSVWSLSFDRVQESSSAAADLLCFYSLLAPDDISNELVIAGAAELGPHLATLVDSETLKKVLAHLLRYSLVERHPQQQSVSIHRLVQFVYKNRMDESTQRVWKERLIKAVYRAFTAAQHQHVEKRDRYIPHAQVCLDYITHEKFVFSEAQLLLADMGRYLRQRALYAQSEAFSMQALSIVEHMGTPLHPDRAIILTNIGHLRQEQGKYEEALSLFRQANRIWEKKPVTTDYEVAYAVNLSDIAKALIEQGKLEEARPYAEKAAKMIESVSQAEAVEIGYCLMTLASLYYDQTNYAQAEELYRRALSLHEQQNEPDMEELAICLTNLVTIDLLYERYEEAEEFAQRAYNILRSIQGMNHPGTAHCLISLGDVHVKGKKDFATAERMYQQALDIYSTVLDSDHPDVFEALACLAIVNQLQEKLEEAEEFYLKALHIAHMDPDIDATKLMLKYSTLLESMGKSSEAERMREQASSMKEERQRRATSIDE